MFKKALKISFPVSGQTSVLDDSNPPSAERNNLLNEKVDDPTLQATTAGYTGQTYCRAYDMPPMLQISDFGRSDGDLHHRSDNYIIIPR